MPPQRLLHHLRRYRKIAGLSQRDLARLLGCQSGDPISRYEHFKGMPSLKTAVACEVILGAPLSALFPGLHVQVKREVRFQAQVLLARLKKAPTKANDTRIMLCRSLANVSTVDPQET